MTTGEEHSFACEELTNGRYSKLNNRIQNKSVDRNISVIKDINGNSIVIINDIIFKGKKSIDWEDVERYLRRYIGEFYTIASTNEIVFMGKDLPEEYAHSEYTESLRGANIKIKANAAQGIPEMLETAFFKAFTNNKKAKHNKDAKFGWYKYESRFALPIIGTDGEVLRYNVFCTAMIIRHGMDDKKYLYDIINIKKETSCLFQSEDLTQ